MRHKLFSAASLFAIAGAAFTTAAFAQQATKPATEQELLTYQTMGALNICYLTSEKVPLAKAFPASLVMVGNVIARKHGSEIIEGGKTIKLEPKQVEIGAVVGITAVVKGMCAEKFEGEDKKQFDAQFDQIQKAIQQQSNK